MNLFLQNLFGKLPAAQPQPLAAPVPILPTTAGIRKNRPNPFMVAYSSDSEDFNAAYGVNQPLEKPMFLGYHNDKSLYGGSRLFILY